MQGFLICLLDYNPHNSGAVQKSLKIEDILKIMAIRIYPENPRIVDYILSQIENNSGNCFETIKKLKIALIEPNTSKEEYLRTMAQNCTKKDYILPIFCTSDSLQKRNSLTELEQIALSMQNIKEIALHFQPARLEKSLYICSHPVIPASKESYEEYSGNFLLKEASPSLGIFTLGTNSEI